MPATRQNTPERHARQKRSTYGKWHWVMAAIAAIDLALWDIRGKLVNQPVYRLLGGSASRIPAYASGGYYGADGGPCIRELVDEVTDYVGQGFTGVKMKIGGLSITEDYERVSAVRAAVGDNIDLMLDANMAYSRGPDARGAGGMTECRSYTGHSAVGDENRCGHV
jgi:L-alanine-DL-glutamate epimerase-like enolase superfamily enzyme